MKVERRERIIFLGAIFFLSGAASLIYQVVWQRLLTLSYGVGSISNALIVGVYMAGLGFGGLMGGRLADRAKGKLTLYFVIELGIGIFGLLSLPYFDFLSSLTAGANYFVSFVSVFLFLCIPTLLMGMTLPLLVKIVNQIWDDFLDTVSMLYFINTLGAAIGALVSSYVLISFWGLDTALYTACAINFLLAAAIFTLRWRKEALGDEKEDVRAYQLVPARLFHWTYVVVFVTGFIAIGYEIIWFRLVGVLVKDSPYAFSSVLFVYLMGLALGSLDVNRRIRRGAIRDKRSLFFAVQCAIGLFVLVSVFGYYYLTRNTPFGVITSLSFSNEVHPNLAALGQRHLPFLVTLFGLGDVFLWPLFFLLIPTMLMGFSFPLIAYLAYTRRENEASTLGRVYFFNVMGNVVGSLVTGFVLLEQLGSVMTLVVFSLIEVAAIFAVRFYQDRRRELPFKLGGYILFASLIVFINPGGYRFYSAIHPLQPDARVYLEEGVDAVVMTYEQEGAVTNYINGLEHGTLGKAIGYYTGAVYEALRYAPEVRRVLIIGYGAGSFTEFVLKLEEVEEVTVVELSSSLMTNMYKLPHIAEQLRDQRLKLVIDDGRRYLIQSEEKYDVILTDPLRVTTAYANNLHCLQFFELARERLTPNGLILLGGMGEKRILPRTVVSVFPQARMYDYFLIASAVPLKAHPEREEMLLSGLPPDLREMTLSYVASAFLGDQHFIQELTAGYPVNLVYKPRTEYYLGLAALEYLGWLPGLSVGD